MNRASATLIYNSAALTIVAARSDRCDAGLPDVSNLHLRPLNRDFWTIEGVDLMMIPAEPRLLLEASHWRKRGWTFKEELCSNRALIFLPNLVMFSCQEATWREDVYLEEEPAQLHGDGLLSVANIGRGGNLHRGAIRTFQGLASQYLDRTLSRTRDIENAFAGVTGLMEGLVGPLCHGVPERFFGDVIDGCWFWDHLVEARASFPRWSWTGWQYTAKHIEEGGITALPTWVDTPLLTFFLVSDELQPLSSSTPYDCHEHFVPDHDKMMRISSGLAAGGHGKGDLLIFYTSSGVLRIQQSLRTVFDDQPSADRIDEYRVLNPDTGRPITSIRLQRRFIDKHGYDLPFIVISHSSAVGAYRLMLIEEVDGIAYKVECCRSGTTSPRGRLVGRTDSGEAGCHGLGASFPAGMCHHNTSKRC